MINDLKQRDNSLDALKGFLIILVIIGHLIGSENDGDSIEGFVRLFIYTFHMPLFILLSGYFTKIRNCSRDLFQSLLPIVKPLIVFQVLSIIFIGIGGGNFLSLEYLCVPYWTLWYLLSLIFWRIMLHFSPRFLLGKPIIYLSIAFLIAIASGLMPYGRLFSIQRTLNFYPFFLCGYFMKGQVIPKKLWKNWVSVLCIIVVGCAICLGLYPSNADMLLRGVDHYGVSVIPTKMCLLVCSFVMSISVLNLSKDNRLLSSIGKDSLLYYLYHGLLIKFLFNPIIRYFELPTSLLWILVYCCAILLIIYCLGRIKLFRWLINPKI